MQISDESIDDLMCTALEGGICHWCERAIVLSKINYTFSSDVISMCGKLRLLDIDGEDSWVLTKELFMKGVNKYCELNDIHDEETLMDTHDADTADQIVQYALFDNVIFC